MANKITLSPEEIDIYAAIGFAQTQWAELEYTLCRIFREAVTPIAADVRGVRSAYCPAEDAFWAVIAFDGRMKMTVQALSRHLHRNSDFACAPLLEEWGKASKRANEKAASRNALAHGSTFGFLENGKHSVRYVPYFYKTMTGRHMIMGPPGGEVRLMSSLPTERWSSAQIYGKAKGFQVGTLRLKHFLNALEAHNAAVCARLAESRRSMVAARSQSLIPVSDRT